MPLDRLVLILMLVVGAAGLTVLVGAIVVAAFDLPALGAALSVPVLLVGYVIWRVIAERMTSREDDRYDHIDR